MSESAFRGDSEIEVIEFACAQADLLIAALKRVEEIGEWCPDELAELRESVTVLEELVIEPARRRLAEIKRRGDGT